MIDPQRNDLDYGKMLEPPKGYELEFAVTTTYSLDLEALVGAYVSLGLSVACDSSLKDDPAHLFAAMAQARGKVLVFCEKGRISCSKEYRELYSQVENGIVQVDLPGTDYPSFHPKIWLLKFKDKEHEENKLYRICVLSRNLTFDDSWDIAVCLEGTYTKPRKGSADGSRCLEEALKVLASFSEGSNISREHKDALKTMREEIQNVYFGGGKFDVSNEGFAPQYPYFIVTGFPGGENREDNSDSSSSKSLARHFSSHLAQADRILIMSPFLPDIFNSKNNPIKDIREKVNTGALQEQNVTFILRRDALLGHEKDIDAIEGFNIFAVRNELLDIVPEEDEYINPEENIKPKDIHAKLFAFECKDNDGIRTYLYLGSANATYRALYKNYEFMLCLSSDNQNAFDYLLSDLGLDEKSQEEGSIFAPLMRKEVETTATQSENEGMKVERDFDHLLRRINANMNIVEAGEADLYDVIIDLKLEKDSAYLADKCIVQLLSDNKSYPLEKKVIFSQVPLLRLTKFIRIKLNPNGPTRLIKCKASSAAQKILELRRAAIFKHIVASSDSSLLQYLQFRLSDNPEQFGFGSSSEMIRRFTGMGLSLASENLYESLLKAYATKPVQTRIIVDDCISLMGQEFEENEATREVRKLLRAFRAGDKNVTNYFKNKSI